VIGNTEVASALNQRTIMALENIKAEINSEYGFQDGIPRINYGPCAVFAQIFFNIWTELFEEKVHICFVMTQSRNECDHVCIRLPSAQLYDGGIGIHTHHEYVPQFVIDEMLVYDLDSACEDTKN
jgi:hypothetical protein